jgi:Pregnancy-associated plasma protein-A/Secretion system C-terminal sorting domain
MKNLYIFLLLLVGLAGFGQTATATGFCHSDEVLQNLKNSDPSLQQRMNRMDEDIRNYGNNYKASPANRPAQTSFTIPVIVYVVHNNQPLGTGSNIRDEQVQAQLAALNTYFVGSGLNFCLATKAGNQTLLQAGGNNSTATSDTAGIVHVNNSTIATHLTTSNSQQALISGTSGNNTLSKDKFLRIWIVDSIDGSTTSGIQGYSYLPGTSSILDGIVMNYRVFGNIANTTCNCLLTANYQQGKILAHEVGHYLGLRHTFDGGCHDISGFNSQIFGDRVIDTPPIQQANLGCPSNVDSCLSDNLPDDISNYMDYTYDACKNHFTTGQQERMLFQLLNYRSGLYDTDNLIFTGVCGSANLISSNFTGSLSNTDNRYIYNICSGSTMYFKPITASTSYPAGAVITYLWDFGNGFTSTLENPSTVYNQSSIIFLNVTLIVTLNGNSSTSTINIYVNNCLPIISSESKNYSFDKNIFSFATGVPVNNDIIDFPGLGVFPNTTLDDGNFQGLAMQNDNNGNVIFFTDGRDVFNGLNPAVKINSAPLYASVLAYPQGQIILKSPTDNNQYFIISKLTSQSANSYFLSESFAGLRYSIVNVNNGIPTMSNSINIPIIPTAPQSIYRTSPFDGSFIGQSAIQVVEKVDGGFWIITTLEGNNGRAYLAIFDFSSSGTINLNNAYLLPNSFNQLVGYENYNILSISPNGDKITFRSGASPTILLDFDKFGGIISKTTNINSNEVYNSIFSTDSKLIYSSLGQMDINTPLVVLNGLSKTLNASVFMYGPDGKIYYSDSKTKLGVIHNPNNKISNNNPNAFNGQDNILKLFFENNNNSIISGNFPNFVHSKKATAYNVNQISSYKVGCGSYKFFPDVPVNSVTPVFTWNFGDPNSGATNNISSLNTPIHVFSGSGSYTVSLTYNGSTTITTQIVITTFTAPAIQGTSSVCFNSGIATTFNSVALLDGQTVVWTRTSGVGTILQNNQSEVQINWTQLPGTISATITDSAGCVGTVTKTIALDPNVVPTFNAFPANICSGSTAPVLQTTSNNIITGVWSPSVISNTITGSYVFNPNVNNCATPVTVNITVLPANDPFCTSNTSCQPNLTLTAPETNTGTKNYKYKNWIKTMTNYSISSGKDVNFKVEDYLVFAPNTHIMSGAKMLGKIETCVVSSSRPIAPIDKVKDAFNNNDVRVYPNPTSNIVNIFSEDDKISKIMIASIEGKLIFEQKLNNETSFQFDLSNFTDGMYILTIETNEGKSIIKKLIKE